ncbi:MAG: ABC transporter ATP-binding protein [Beijerinckiaceae bacterium]
MPVLVAREICKSLGGTEIIRGLSLATESGEFISVVGPSGCGKTTLLTCLAGLRRLDSGAVLFEDRELDAPPEGMSLIFQDYSRSLLPWRRNLENVVFGMRRLAESRPEKRKRAADMLKAVGLAGFEGHFPWQVSGGMQQRVAIARALAAKPRLLLLDEPLAAVDAQTRADIQDLLLKLAAELGKTCLLVTHDVDEAIYMADRVLVLSNRPTRVVEDIRVSLPRPRDQIATRAEPEYLALRERVLTLIRSMRSPA